MQIQTLQHVDNIRHQPNVYGSKILADMQEYLDTWVELLSIEEEDSPQRDRLSELLNKLGEAKPQTLEEACALVLLAAEEHYESRNSGTPLYPAEEALVSASSLLAKISGINIPSEYKRVFKLN